MNYINLGLPSGTLWADSNEQGLFTHKQAISIYNDQIPFEWHWNELKKCCTFIENSEGLTILSKVNNKSLFFPLTGYSEIGYYRIEDLDKGYYWLSDIIFPRNARFMYFGRKGSALPTARVATCSNSYKYAIRLIRSSLDQLSNIF